MRVENVKKVLERLGTTEGVTLVIEPQDPYAHGTAAADEVVEAQHVSSGNTFHDRD